MLHQGTLRGPYLLSLGMALALGCGMANAQGAPQSPTHGAEDEMKRGRMWWGGSSRSGKDVAWALIFGPVDGGPAEGGAAEGVRVGQLRAEIVLPGGQWRFSRVKAADGSPLRVSGKTERADATGAGRSEVLVVTVSPRSKGDAISGGAVAILTFALRGAEAPIPVPPVIRRFTTSSVEVSTDQQPSALEPPPADPPANPAVGCFFFSH